MHFIVSLKLPFPKILPGIAGCVSSVGNDVVSIRRIESMLKRSSNGFKSRCFTEREIGDCLSRQKPEIHFAGKWAAKEAVYKALSLRWNRAFSWKEIEIISSGKGPPEVCLAESVVSDLTYPILEIYVSISHCSEYAFSTAVTVRPEKRSE